MTKIIETDVLIIGSGPAGYTAAIYAARANLKPHLVSGLEPGGQLTITTDVENYPGFGDVIQGPWLMEQMKEQALKVGTEFHNDIVKNVNFDLNPFTAETDSGLEFKSKSIIIATGAQARWLNLESENKFKGFGISACATCDGFFFKNQKIVVVGGGNSAVEEALYLTNFASKVTLVHRRDKLRAEKILQERLLKHPKIEIIWDHTVDEFIGSEEPLSLNKIKLKNTKNNNEKIIDATGAFLPIGLLRILQSALVECMVQSNTYQVRMKYPFLLPIRQTYPVRNQGIEATSLLPFQQKLQRMLRMRLLVAPIIQ